MKPELSDGGVTLARRVVLAAIALTVLLGAAFPFLVVALFETVPPLWPDEALFASAATDLIENGRLGTPLLAGVVPGIGEHTYWVPPLHFLYLATFFKVLGPGVFAARLSSVVTGVAVLVLLQRVSRRAGIGRWAAWLPPALLAADHVFLRGALVARMDMLCVALVLLALWLWLAPDRSRKRSAAAGAATGLAVLTHPMGLAVLVALLATEAVRRRMRHVLAMVLGGLPVALVWGVYALQDVESFTAQVGGQFARKSAQATTWATGIEMSVAQHGLVGWLVAAVWLAGLAGLVVATVRRRTAAPLLVVHVLLLMLVLPSGEIWYPLYLLPLGYLGLAELVGLAQSADVRRIGLGCAAAFASVSFAAANVAESMDVYAQLDENADAADYGRFTRDVSRAIPSGSRVLLASIPDPWFGLRGRGDIELRAFVPDRLQVDRASQEAHLMSCTHVILGRYSPSRAVGEFVRTRGRLVAEVGDAGASGYYAAIFRVDGR